jgi:hypothetical protein
MASVSSAPQEAGRGLNGAEHDEGSDRRRYSGDGRNIRARPSGSQSKHMRMATRSCLTVCLAMLGKPQERHLEWAAIPSILICSTFCTAKIESSERGRQKRLSSSRSEMQTRQRLRLRSLPMPYDHWLDLCVHFLQKTFPSQSRVGLGQQVPSRAALEARGRAPYLQFYRKFG